MQLDPQVISKFEKFQYFKSKTICITEQYFLLHPYAHLREAET